MHLLTDDTFAESAADAKKNGILFSFANLNDLLVTLEDQ